MDSSTSPDGTSAALPEVSWQTCFWILITLALNTMAQPCGKICNRDSRYSTYMRSLPFICLAGLADILSIFSKVGYRRWTLGISIRKCVRIVIDEKFGTHEEVLVFARSSWLRWLFSILGPMPQAIRLASFRGTFWTQFFGFSYLLSWLLTEILGLISARTVGQNAATTDHINFEFLDGLYETLATICYIFLLSYSSGCFIRKHPPWGKSQEWDSLDLTVIVLMFTVILLSLYIRDNLIVRALSILCRRNTVMGQNLLVAFPEGETRTLKVDDDAVSWLVRSVANLLLCLAGYRFLYDSSGTVNPGWTAVFG